MNIAKDMNKANTKAIDNIIVSELIVFVIVSLSEFSYLLFIIFHSITEIKYEKKPNIIKCSVRVKQINKTTHVGVALKKSKFNKYKEVKKKENPHIRENAKYLVLFDNFLSSFKTSEREFKNTFSFI